VVPVEVLVLVLVLVVEGAAMAEEVAGAENLAV